MPAANYAFTDTDSMTIIASEQGGLVPCVGGSERLPDGTPAMRALSRAQLDAIIAQFDALNPFDRGLVPHLLKDETADWLPEGHTHRQPHVVTISAKRYAPYVLDDDGNPVVGAAKAHGLGHVRDPLDDLAQLARGGETTDDGAPPLKPWMVDGVWLPLLRRLHGLPPLPEPDWYGRPAVGRLSISSPDVWQRWRTWNRGRPYAQQVKPGGFLLTAYVRSGFDYPPEAYVSDRKTGQRTLRFRLVAPYVRDAATWAAMPWTNLYAPAGPRYRLGRLDDDGEAVPLVTIPRPPNAIAAQPSARWPGWASWFAWNAAPVVAVQTYGDLIRDYWRHPERKSAGPDGRPCDWETRGLLGRRHVLAVTHRRIGKETNRLDAVEEGLIADADAITLEYTTDAATLAALRRVLAGLDHGALAREVGISRQQLTEILAGRAEPEARTRAALERASRTALTDGLRLLDDRSNPAHLSFDALAKQYAEHVAATRLQLAADLGTLTEAVGERCAARRIGVAQKTVNRWRRTMPADSTTLAALLAALRPHGAAITRLRETVAQLQDAEAERTALRLTLEADPHARFTDWLARTDSRYDAATWRTAGRLVPRRRPRAGVGAGTADWLRTTVDLRDILDRDAQALGEDWPRFWAGVEHAAQQRVQLARLDRDRARLQQQYERHRQQLREATGTQTHPATSAADRKTASPRADPAVRHPRSR
jgi:hypothetical protein